jgi:hypothetical protein
MCRASCVVRRQSTAAERAAEWAAEWVGGSGWAEVDGRCGVWCGVSYLRVPVMSEPDDDHTLLFGEDGLVDLPSIRQVWEHVRHGGNSTSSRAVWCGCGVVWCRWVQS